MTEPVTRFSRFPSMQEYSNILIVRGSSGQVLLIVKGRVYVFGIVDSKGVFDCAEVDTPERLGKCGLAADRMTNGVATKNGDRSLFLVNKAKIDNRTKRCDLFPHLPL